MNEIEAHKASLTALFPDWTVMVSEDEHGVTSTIEGRNGNGHAVVSASKLDLWLVGEILTRAVVREASGRLEVV